jgi:hypothetical protein
MNASEKKAMVVNEEKAALNKRMESVAWGLFIIMLGGFAFVPKEMVPKGAWSVGVGVIMLGLNLARYLNKVRLSGFTTVLGIIALVGGIVQLMGFTQLEDAILLIILGIYIIFKPFFDKHALFGKAEEG